MWDHPCVVLVDDDNKAITVTHLHSSSLDDDGDYGSPSLVQRPPHRAQFKHTDPWGQSRRCLFRFITE